MKKLLFIMMAILLVNMSYAGELGENQKGDCINSPNHSRGQDRVLDDASTSSQESSAEETVVSE